MKGKFLVFLNEYILMDTEKNEWYARSYAETMLYPEHQTYSIEKNDGEYDMGPARLGERKYEKILPSYLGGFINTLIIERKRTLLSLKSRRKKIEDMDVVHEDRMGIFVVNAFNSNIFYVRKHTNRIYVTDSRICSRIVNIHVFRDRGSLYIKADNISSSLLGLLCRYEGDYLDAIIRKEIENTEKKIDTAEEEIRALKGIKKQTENTAVLM
jgi:hypothetical protein